MIKLFKLKLICTGVGGTFLISHYISWRVLFEMSQILMSKYENSFEMLQADFRRFTFLEIAKFAPPSPSFARLHSIRFAPSRGQIFFLIFSGDFSKRFSFLPTIFSELEFRIRTTKVPRVHSIIASL